MSLAHIKKTTTSCEPMASMDDSSFESTTTASSSGSGSEDIDCHTRKAAAAPRKNTSRERMKAERAFLGKKVVELERELSALLAKKAVARCETPSPAVKGLAKRQQARRQKAEDENAQLRSRLLYQLQVAKSLETVLRNRASSFLEDLRERKGQSRYPVYDLEALHEKCMEEIDQVYTLADSIFTDVVWADVVVLGAPTRRSRVVTEEEHGRERLLVDLHTKCYVPFPLERVCKATWRAITTEYERPDRLIKLSASTDEELKTKFWLEQSPIVGGDESRLSGTITMRTFQEDKRMVMVWRGLVFKETPQGIFLFGEETGWLAVEKALDPVTLEPSEEASTMRAWTRYVPVWDFESETRTTNLAIVDAADGSQELVSKNAANAVGEFTNHVLTGAEADMSAITEAIGNILLDEAVGPTDEELEFMVEHLDMLASGVSTEPVGLTGVELDFGL